MVYLSSVGNRIYEMLIHYVYHILYFKTYIAARFQTLKNLEKGILKELDPKTSTDILLLKLAAVEASVGDLNMGGIDSSNANI